MARPSLAILRLPARPFVEEELLADADEEEETPNRTLLAAGCSPSKSSTVSMSEPSFSVVVADDEACGAVVATADDEEGTAVERVLLPL